MRGIVNLFRGKPQTLGEGLKRVKEAFGVTAGYAERTESGVRNYRAADGKRVQMKLNELSNSLNIDKYNKLNQWECIDNEIAYVTEYRGLQRNYCNGKKSTNMHEAQSYGQYEHSHTTHSVLYGPYDVIERIKAVFGGIA